MGSTTAMPKMRHIAVRCRVTIKVPMGFNMDTDKALDDPTLIDDARAEILAIVQTLTLDDDSASFAWQAASIGELVHVLITDSSER